MGITSCNNYTCSYKQRCTSRDMQLTSLTCLFLGAGSRAYSQLSVLFESNMHIEYISQLIHGMYAYLPLRIFLWCNTDSLTYDSCSCTPYNNKDTMPPDIRKLTVVNDAVSWIDMRDIAGQNYSLWWFRCHCLEKIVIIYERPRFG